MIISRARIKIFFDKNQGEVGKKENKRHTFITAIQQSAIILCTPKAYMGNSIYLLTVKHRHISVN